MVSKYWKCKCMKDKNYHGASMDLMSGSWEHHMGLCNHMYPYGLHREWYQLTDDVTGSSEVSEEDIILVKIRCSGRLVR